MAYDIKAKDCLALLMESVHGYRASVAAAKRHDYESAMSYQLQAVDSMNEFTTKYLKELELLRKGGARKTWAP